MATDQRTWSRKDDAENVLSLSSASRMRRDRSANAILPDKTWKRLQLQGLSQAEWNHCSGTEKNEGACQ